MKYRRFFTFLTLFSLLLELSDSSTNFIRANSESPSTSFMSQNGATSFNVIKALMNLLDSGENDHGDKDQDANSTHSNDVSVHYSYPATTFSFNPTTIGSGSFNLFSEIFIDQYYPSIFQPPKIA